MKTYLTVIFFIYPVLLLPVFGQTADKKIKIILIGTFHWRPTSDKYPTTVNDLYSAKRQLELGDLLQKLSHIEADKIFVEAVPEQQPFWDSVFTAYKNGIEPDEKIRHDEIFQIAFKLALKRNLDGVRCVNFFPDSLFAERHVCKSKSERSYAGLLSNDAAVIDSLLHTDPDRRSEVNHDFMGLPSTYNYHRYDSLVNHSTLIDFYKYLNSPGYRNIVDYGNWLYFNYNAGNKDDLVGADFTSNIWYARNMKIFVNILRQTDRKKDSCYIVLYGAAHIPFLTYLFKQDPYFEVVDVSKYLH